MADKGSVAMVLDATLVSAFFGQIRQSCRFLGGPDPLQSRLRSMPAKMSACSARARAGSWERVSEAPVSPRDADIADRDISSHFTKYPPGFPRRYAILKQEFPTHKQ